MSLLLVQKVLPRDFVTCDFVTLRCSHICENSQSIFFIIIYII